MNQLIERVLAVGSRLTPVNRTGRISDFRTVECDVLSIALHRQLLQIGWKSLQVLLVRQHGSRLSAEKVGVPDSQKAHQHREVSLERSGAEMLVHLVEAVQHCAEVVRSD